MGKDIYCDLNSVASEYREWFKEKLKEAYKRGFEDGYKKCRCNIECEE